MTSNELTNKAKQVIAQAEQKLLDKRNQQLVDAIKSIKIEQPQITVNPPEINIPPINPKP